MNSRSDSFAVGSGRLPPTHIGQTTNEIPPHLAKLWKAHKVAATIQAAAGLAKPGGVHKVADFAYGMHLHPGNTPFGRQYTRGLHEHSTQQAEAAKTSTTTKAKSAPAKNPWGQPTGDSQPGPIPKPFEPSTPKGSQFPYDASKKGPKQTAGEKLHEQRRATAEHKASLEQAARDDAHAKNLEVLKAKADAAAAKTAPKAKAENQPEHTPPTAGAGPKVKQPQLPLKYNK